jgi:hypothetical protein
LGSENRKKFLPRKEWMNETTLEEKATAKGQCSEMGKDDKDEKGKRGECLEK